MKKYRLADRIKYGDKTLWEIEALLDFGTIRKGQKGGLVEGEWNLSQKGDCWIWQGSKVMGRAKVWGNAQVWGNAIVMDAALVGDFAKVYDRAKVCGNADIYGEAQIYGDAVVSGTAKVWGRARVSGTAIVGGEAEVWGFADIYSGTFTKERICGINEPLCDPAFRNLTKI